MNFLNIIPENCVEKIKTDEDLRILKGFRYSYLLFFIISCFVIFWTKSLIYLCFLFLPFIYVFGPIKDMYGKGFVLIRFKEFYFLFLLSCIFSIFVFMLLNGYNISFTFEFVLGLICWILFFIFYFRDCWLEFNNLKSGRISTILMLLSGLGGVLLFRFIGFY